MATTNYLNPTGVRPEYGWKPQGFLAGMNYSRDRQRYDQLAPLQDAITQMGAMEQSNKLDEYGLDAPVRDAKREEKIAVSQSLAETAGPRATADLENVTLGNDLNRGTKASKISEAIAAAAIKEGDAGMAKLQKAVTVAQALSQSLGQGGPAAGAQIQQVLKQANVDPNDPMVKYILSAPSPKEMQKRANILLQVFTEAMPAYRQSMDVQKLQNQGGMQRQGLANQGQLATANARAQAKTQTAAQFLANYPAMTKNPEQAYTMLQMIIADNDLDPSLKAKAVDMAARIQPLVQARIRQDPAVFGGMPAGQRPSVDPNQSQAGGTWIPGKPIKLK